MSQPSDKTIYSIELMRVIAMLAIILLHSQVLLDAPLIGEEPWPGYVLNQLCRFGVPFFFITAGFLIQPKLAQSPGSTLLRYALPLGKVWIVWSLICLAIPFRLDVVAEHGYLAERTGYWNWLMEAPFNTLMEGGLVHLWYIPGLLCGLAVIALLQKPGSKITWAAVSALYLYGVMGGSYQELTGLWTPFFTRNGPFFASLMIFIGYEIRRSGWRLSATQSALLAVAGLAVHLTEAGWLNGYGIPFNIHDFLFGTTLWATGLFMWLLSKPQLGSGLKWLPRLSSLTLGVYVAHLPIVILMMNLAGFLAFPPLASDALVYFGAVAVTYPLVWVISVTPFNKLLLR